MSVDTRAFRLPGFPSAFFTIGSQALNSGGNLLVSVMVARSATPGEFGQWSLVYVAYVFILAVLRATVFTVPLLAGEAPRRPDVNALYSVTCLLGVAYACALGSVAVLMGLVYPYVWLFAVSLPALLMQDLARYLSFVSRRPAMAMMSDGLWMLVLVGFFFLGPSGPNAVTAAWVVGGCAGLLFLWGGYRPSALSIPMAKRFLRERRHAIRALASEAVLVVLSASALPFVVAGVAGLSQTGYLRAALTMMGGVSVTVGGMIPLLTLRLSSPEGAQAPERTLRTWSFLVAGISGVYGLCLLTIPTSVGSRILGANWMGASPLFVPLVLQSIIRGPLTGVPVLLRVWQEFRALVLLTAVIAFQSVAIPAVGAVLDGAAGAAWGLAASAVIGSVLGLTVLNHVRRRRADVVGRRRVA